MNTYSTKMIIEMDKINCPSCGKQQPRKFPLRSHPPQRKCSCGRYFSNNNIYEVKKSIKRRYNI